MQIFSFFNRVSLFQPSHLNFLILAWTHLHNFHKDQYQFQPDDFYNHPYKASKTHTYILSKSYAYILNSFQYTSNILGISLCLLKPKVLNYHLHPHLASFYQWKDFSSNNLMEYGHLTHIWSKIHVHNHRKYPAQSLKVNLQWIHILVLDSI